MCTYVCLDLWPPVGSVPCGECWHSVEGNNHNNKSNNDDNNNNLCASAAGPLENAISYLCVCVLLQGCRKEDPQTECCGKNGKILKRGDLVDS